MSQFTLTATPATSCPEHIDDARGGQPTTPKRARFKTHYLSSPNLPGALTPMLNRTQLTEVTATQLRHRGVPVDRGSHDDRSFG